MKAEILEYFKTSKLRSLDKEGFYDAVTPKYIYEYVLEKKYPLSDVAKMVFKLCQEGTLGWQLCWEIEKLVIYRGTGEGYRHSKIQRISNTYWCKTEIKHFNELLN